MAAKTVAIMSTGDMGHNVAKVLKKEGLRVVTCLAGRSERTRGLAVAAAVEELASAEDVVSAADLVLSILPPGNALDNAREIAAAMTASGSFPHYADCNAVSPQTAKQVAEVVTGAGAQFSDAGIVGPGPGTRENRPGSISVARTSVRWISWRGPLSSS